MFVLYFHLVLLASLWERDVRLQCGQPGLHMRWLLAAFTCEYDGSDGIPTTETLESFYPQFECYTALSSTSISGFVALCRWTTCVTLQWKSHERKNLEKQYDSTLLRHTKTVSTILADCSVDFKCTLRPTLRYHAVAGTFTSPPHWNMYVSLLGMGWTQCISSDFSATIAIPSKQTLRSVPAVWSVGTSASGTTMLWAVPSWAGSS